MILFLFSLCLVYWFKLEIAQFPTKINQQLYQDYASMISPNLPNLSLAEFLAQSQLQAKSSYLINLFFILLPLITFWQHHLSLPIIFILFILSYLSLLDYFYYLTDVQYVAIVFILSLWQLLFYDNVFLYERLFSLFITTLFFLLFHLISQFILKREGLGIGDMLLFIAISPLFSLEKMIELLLFACVFGLLFALGYFLWTKRKIARLPFVPFISLSTLIGIVGKI
ncbi:MULTISPECIES: prepilin peptidase [Glaesserella]|uniref:Peptidase n=1 Tax=Glaesserella australis TaxID=2094024 RepID=A0A328C2A5_9PAST|nr:MULTISPECIES: prepilin peptidase [Glaesserella]AUI65372.1 peptidase [Glaesserella sp. 15-184]RAL18644.1 peptidase [Glaesserella australis]